MDDFPTRLRALMDYRQVSSSELARAADVGATALSNWLNGRNEPREREVVNRIASALRVSPSMLWFAEPRLNEDFRVAEALRDRGFSILDQGKYRESESSQLMVEEEGFARTPQMRINPEFQPKAKRKASGWGAIDEYLSVWAQAAAENPDVAPYVLMQLRKHLPMEDLQLFRKTEQES